MRQCHSDLTPFLLRTYNATVPFRPDPFSADSLKAEGASDAEALARAALDEVIPAEDVHDFLEYVGSFYGAGMDWAIENNISDSRHVDDLDLLLRRRGSKTIYPPNE